MTSVCYIWPILHILPILSRHITLPTFLINTQALIYHTCFLLLLINFVLDKLITRFIYLLSFDFIHSLIHLLTNLPTYLLNAGELIIKLAPQIVINHSAPDFSGQPLVMETYNFSVKDIFEAVTIDQYIM